MLELIVVLCLMLIAGASLGAVSAMIQEKWPWLGHGPLLVAMAISVALSVPLINLLIS